MLFGQFGVDSCHIELIEGRPSNCKKNSPERPFHQRKRCEYNRRYD